MMKRALFFVVCFSLAGNAFAEPRIKTLKLTKHTVLTVDLVPDMGTRFVFPFVLDEKDDFVPFTLTITNPIFVPDRSEGRNSFVVKIATPKEGGRLPNYYSNMFVTVAGYQISVELRSTSSLTHHYSDIVFELGDAEREDLIQKGIAQRTKALEAEYQQKLADLDKAAEQRAIARVGVLALRKPTSDRIKEEVSKTLADGDKLILFVDEAITYDPYAIFKFELTNDSNTRGISVLDAKLFAVNTDTKSERPLDAAKDLPPRLIAGARAQGVITAVDPKLNTKEVLKLQVLTDKGTVEAQW